MTIAAIHQPQYLPYLGFFQKLARCDVFVALDDVQFLRRGLQHRNKIKDSKGWQWLTVPVIQHDGQSISEVVINPTEPWQRKHANALQWNYRRAPYYDQYAPELVEILQRPWTNLCELNMEIMRATMKFLGIDTPVVLSSDVKVQGRRSELLVNLCHAVGAVTYLSGPGGKRYMDLDVFDAAAIEVEWQDFIHPVYPQLFPAVGFIPNLAIVDALLCWGPEAATFVRRS